MAKLAIVSDIHANIEALTVVMNAIDDMGIARENILCLGDVVGYGPNPVECVDIAMDFRFTILGNHDEALVNGCFGFSPSARRAIEWTQTQLKPSTFSSPLRRKRWEFIAGLGLEVKTDKYYFVHGSPRDPTMEYILKADTDAYFGEVPPKIREIFSMIHGPCFVGHSHVPCVITEQSQYYGVEDLDYEFKFEPGQKYIVNVGSVGQPRDQDVRSCFVTLDEDEGVIRWHRYEFDWETTAEKIRAIPGLDNRNADRLAKGM